MVYVNATGTCLATKEKGYLQTIRNNIQQITSQIVGLENSLKGTKIESTGCQKGWHRYREHCYFFSSEKRNWFHSERYCRLHGGYLAKIEDAKENAWILTRAPKGDHVMWLGASDLKVNQWLWNEDFSPMKYTHWYKGEPNGGTIANCLNLMGEKYNGRWNDHICDTSLQFLCKKKMKCSCHGK